MHRSLLCVGEIAKRWAVQHSGLQGAVEARDTVQVLLEQLGLMVYLLEFEPRTDHREVRVECSPNSVWQSFDSERGRKLARGLSHRRRRASQIARGVAPALTTMSRPDCGARYRCVRTPALPGAHPPGVEVDEIRS